jgi:hypothetical protein
MSALINWVINSVSHPLIGSSACSVQTFGRIIEVQNIGNPTPLL